MRRAPSIQSARVVAFPAPSTVHVTPSASSACTSSTIADAPLANGEKQMSSGSVRPIDAACESVAAWVLSRAPERLAAEVLES